MSEASEEHIVINCVAIFYEEGKGGENFRRKNKFRCRTSLVSKQPSMDLKGMSWSARTVASVAMIDTGLQRLYANLEKFVYKHTNVLSCMTLDVANCHSTVHVKQANMSKAQNCRSFGLAMKEAVNPGVKRVTT